MALPFSSLNKHQASVTSAQVSQHHLLFFNIQPHFCSVQADGWTARPDLLCFLFVCDGCLGSGFSLRDNMAKQTDCSEIRPDTQMYIIEQALMGLSATARVYIQGQAPLIMPRRVSESHSLGSLHQPVSSNRVVFWSHDLAERRAGLPGSPSGCDS